MIQKVWMVEYRWRRKGQPKNKSRAHFGWRAWRFYNLTHHNEIALANVRNIRRRGSMCVPGIYGDVEVQARKVVFDRRVR